MMGSIFKLIAAATLLLVGQAQAGNDPHAEGQALFEKNCAICHAVALTKAPEVSALEKMDREFIVNSLTQGRMVQQGSVLSSKEVLSVVDYLTRNQPPRENWAEAAACADSSVNLQAGPVLGDWGYGAANQRRVSAAEGGITPENASRLVFSQPAQQC